MLKGLLVIVLLRVVAAMSLACNCTGRCVVETTTGKYSGVEDQDGVHFLGIRYAEPPVDALRFADPVPFVPDESTLYSATTPPPSCLQYSGVQSEDCLFLNVFRPKSSMKHEKLPVMVWVHGGSFYLGGISDPVIDGAKLANAKNMVIVTIQYRLGAFGLYDDGTNTNFAIKDALLALKWVKKNIHRFDGDKKRVTLAGQSSGATLIRGVLSSKKGKGLFNRVISMSDPIGFGFNKRSTSVGVIGAMMANVTGCSDIACMRGLPAEAILEAQAVVIANGHATNPAVNYAQPFSPVIDDVLIKKDFAQYVSDGDLPVKVPLLIGTVADEANAIVESALPTAVPVTYYPFVLQQFMSTVRAALIVASLQFVPNFADPDATRHEAAFVAKLFYWTCAVQRNAVKFWTKMGQKVYIYEMENGIEYPATAGLTLCGPGYVCHQADLEVLFGTYDVASVTSAQIALSAEVQERWYQFISRGSPNSGQYVNWKPIQYLLNLNLLKLGQEKIVKTLYPSRCNLVFGSVVEYDYQMYSE
ncbi:Carboxylesterase [Lipomyces arxii]|uniref:Carboxylesterase n=1 Tax=Lipomyces arxii TaxID=56418 RepID=UPI0034CDC678